MTEHPILFCGPRVRAIYDDRKTQTRRVVREPMQAAMRKDEPTREYDNGARWLTSCPFGQPGDRLWVRETWAHDCPHCEDVRCGNPDHIWYRSNEIEIVARSFAGSARWRPSIHMPRWASRLTLEIVSVRVERLQDISEEDARAEGVEFGQRSYGTAYRDYRGEPGAWFIDARASFGSLWDTINAERGHGWHSNPWVWAIEFKQASR